MALMQLFDCIRLQKCKKFHYGILRLVKCHPVGREFHYKGLNAAAIVEYM